MPTFAPVSRDVPFAELLESARAGERQALEQLTAEFYSDVQRMVHARLRRDLSGSRAWLASRFSTGDVVQEVFQDVLRDLDTFRGATADAFVGYLSIVVRNRIIDAVRFHNADRRDARRSVPAEAAGFEAATSEDPAEVADQIEQERRLQDVLGTFEPREQLLLRARLEGLATFQELADQLGYATESGARRAYYAAHSRLALAIGRDGR